MSGGEVSYRDLGRDADWLAQNRNSEVVLSGVLARRDNAVAQQDWLWVKSTASEPSRDDLLSNITVGQGESRRRVTCHHATQPRNNFTVFYRRLTDTQIVVIGYGNHVGNDNKKYRVDWADGSTSTIDVRQTNKTSPEHMANNWLREDLRG